MAKRRKVGNLLALSLLSLLAQKPMYPYEMAQTLRARGKEENFKINWGSLYTVVQNLEKNGFIEAAVIDRDGRQPERTTYEITETGLGELRDWLSELLSAPQDERDSFVAALSEAGILPPDEVIGLLTARLATLDKTNASHQADLKLWAERLPRVLLVESEYQLAMRLAQAELAARAARRACRRHHQWHGRLAAHPRDRRDAAGVRGTRRAREEGVGRRAAHRQRGQQPGQLERPQSTVLQHREPRSQPHHQSRG